MQEKEETFRKQILATVGDLEHAKHLARERSGYDAIATKVCACIVCMVHVHAYIRPVV